MPTDPSINLTTSAAAAFCARLCVHPLDHLKASLQHVEPLPREHGIRLRLDHLLTTIRHHLHTLHHKQHHRKHHHTTFREQITFWRGLYHGVPLALIINVPALAFFLSTYDATKHGIAFVSSHLDFSHFQLHHFETHLISGMMAKVAGTILWAPMAKLTEMQRNSRHGHGGQLSLQEALLLIRKTVAAEGSGSGVWSHWSGYRTTLTSLLPYTMLYFATYEKLKQFARRAIISREEQQNGASNNSTATGGGGVIDYRTDRRPLDLGTYMVCVAGAVAISATVCHTADALRVHIKELWTTSVLPTKSTSTPSPISPTPSSSSTAFRTSGSIMTAKPMAPTLTTTPQQYHPHMWASPAPAHAHAHAAVTQHANMTTTTTTPTQSPRRPLVVSGNGAHRHLQRRKQLQQGGLLRRLGRGLGPRVMWTAPGVTLTTAGFEVFRNIALGVV